MRIDNWKIVSFDTPNFLNVYPCVVMGNIYGRQKTKDGSLYITHPIKIMHNNWVYCANGETFELGKKR